MASLDHIRCLQLVDDVLAVTVYRVLADIQTGADGLARASLIDQMHDGNLSLAEQLLLVDVYLPFLAAERVAHQGKMAGLGGKVEETDGIAHATLTMALEVEYAVAGREISAVTVAHAHGVFEIPVEGPVRVRGAHKLIVDQFLQMAAALVVGVNAAQYLLFPDGVYLLIAARRLEAQDIAGLAIVYMALVGAEIAQYGNRVFAHRIRFGDEAELQFLIFIQTAVHLLAQPFVELVIDSYHCLWLLPTN